MHASRPACPITHLLLSATLLGFILSSLLQDKFKFRLFEVSSKPWNGCESAGYPLARGIVTWVRSVEWHEVAVNNTSCSHASVSYLYWAVTVDGPLFALPFNKLTQYFLYRRYRSENVKWLIFLYPTVEFTDLSATKRAVKLCFPFRKTAWKKINSNLPSKRANVTAIWRHSKNCYFHSN